MSSFDPAPRRSPNVQRSQLATELLLTAFALVATVILIRTVLVLLEVSDRVWLGSFVYGLTDPITDPMSHFPGSDRVIYGELNVVDVTLLATIPLFLLGVVATGRRGD